MQEDQTKDLVKVPESNLFVRFQDCDPFGHLNNARYIDYFLNTREEHSNTYYNLSLMEIAREQNANWVIAQHQISYLRPADLGERIVVQTKLIHFDNSTIVLEGTMLNEGKTQLKALLWSTMRFVNLQSGRPTDHSDQLMDLLELLDVAEIDYDPDGFQERVKELSRQIKKQAS